MDRVDAERVFRLVADLHGELRDRLVPDRWWLVWAVMGLEIFATNALTQVLLWHGDVRPLIHFSIFGGQIVALAATIRIAQRRAGGVRTERETFIWWIWTMFLVAAGMLVVMESLLGLPLFTLASVVPLLAAMSFSAIAMSIDRAFITSAGLFVACAVAMAIVPHAQFVIYGLTWFVTLEAFAVLHRPRRPIAGRTL